MSDDVEMKKDGATKFCHPSRVEELKLFGWKEAKAAPAKKPAKESK